MNDPSFVNELTSYDVAFLSETHTGFENHIDVEGFQQFLPFSTIFSIYISN